MVSLMQRRRMMMQAAGATPTGPLYQLKQGTTALSNIRYVTVTGNNISDNNPHGGISSRNVYIDAESGGSSAISTTWFSLHAGDVVVLKIRNFAYTNDYTSGTSQYLFSLRDSTDTAIVIFTKNMPKGESGTFADEDITVTLGADVNACCFRFYSQRKSLADFDFELWVNGIQYF